MTVNRCVDSTMKYGQQFVFANYPTDSNNVLWHLTFYKDGTGSAADTLDMVDEVEVLEDGVCAMSLLNDMTIRDYVKKRLGYKHFRLIPAKYDMEPRGGVYQFH